MIDPEKTDKIAKFNHTFALIFLANAKINTREIRLPSFRKIKYARK